MDLNEFILSLQASVLCAFSECRIKICSWKRSQSQTRVSLLLCVILAGTEGHIIKKRNAFQMCNLINGFTGRSCLSYNPYGCFCGYGQQGAESLDNADKYDITL